MKRRTFVAGSTAVAGAFTTGMLLKTAPAFAEPRTFKFAFPDAASHPIAAVCHNFKKNLEARTHGRLTVEIYPGGTIGSETSLVGGLQTGILDASMSTGA
ncbi:MAG: hypothetical protein ABR975_14800, partial [Vulcanimicrobiaceae bacterium]